MSGPLAAAVDRLRRLRERLGRDRPSLTTPPVTDVDEEGRRIRYVAIGSGGAVGDDESVSVGAVDTEPAATDGSPVADDVVADLVAMYDDFDADQRAQGTPPAGTNAIRDWLATVLAGPGVVARHEDRVVGHVTFVPDGEDGHELAVFVHPDYQRAGIGTTLLRVGLGHASDLGLQDVWLTVESRKTWVVRLYRRYGFRTVGPVGATQRMNWRR